MVTELYDDDKRTILKYSNPPPRQSPMARRRVQANFHDLEAAIDLNLEKEVEQVKDQAREAVRKKVAEELNIVDEGQDLEDAAKQKLEDEVKKGLRSLFD